MVLNYYRTKSSKKDVYQFRISISFNGLRFQSSITSLCSKDFDAVEKKIKGGRAVLTNDAEMCYNTYQRIAVELDRVEQALNSGYVKISSVDIRKIVNDCKGKAPREECEKMTLEKIMLEYMRDVEQAKSQSEGTQREHRKILNSVIRSGITFEEFAEQDGLKRYEMKLLKNGISNHTIRQYTSRIKTFLRWCYLKDYCGSQFEKYTCRLKEADQKERAVIYLTNEEVKRIEQLDLSGTIEIVRDVFLFQCYTGLRISDASGLRWAEVGSNTLKITTQKTGIFIEIPIIEQAKRILNKYRQYSENGYYYVEPGAVFPKFSTATFNSKLYTIGARAGLHEKIIITDYRGGVRSQIEREKWQLLTTHVGRRTFIVNALSMGFTDRQVMSITGHADSKSLQPYVNITERCKNEIMSNIEKIFG